MTRERGTGTTGYEPFFTGHIAGWVRRHRRFAVVVWITIAVVTIGTCGALGANEDLSESGRGDSAAAFELLDERFETGSQEDAGSETIVFRHPTLTVDDPQYQAVVEGLLAGLRGLRSESSEDGSGTRVISSTRVFSSTFSHYDIGAPRDQSPLVAQLATGGDVTFATAEYARDVNEVETIKQLVDDAAASSGFEILIGGGATTNEELNEIINEGFSFVSLAGSVGSFVLLLLALGSIVAAFVPIVIAYIGVLMAGGIVTVISHATPMSDVWLQVVLLMGLAAGIDYALFLFTRFRYEREQGADVDTAASIASHTAGKGVFIAAVTTMLAINGMFLVNNATFTSLGIAAVVTIFVSLLIAMTFMPALLGDRLSKATVPLVGKRLNIAQAGLLNPLAGALVSVATRYHPIFATAGVVLMLALALPMTQLNLGFNGARSLHDDVESKAAIIALEEDFTIGQLSPALVVADPGPGNNIFAEDVQLEIASFLDSVTAENQRAETAGEHVPFAQPFGTSINDAGDAELIEIPLNSDTGDDEALDAVRLLRETLIPEAFDSETRVLVGGETAANIDFKDGIIARTPLVIAFVVVTAYVVLVVLYRSLVIPAIAVVLNLLAVGAAYGVLVLVFQEGQAPPLEDAMGFEATGIVESWLPLFVFSIMFGISMDYLTFAIGRVQELYHRGYSTEEAINTGIREGFGIVFSAAAIMIAVAAAFAFTKFFALQQFGFTLALAVFFDATVILLVLLPAMLRLAHDRLWYLPAWLNWLPGGPSDFPEAADPRRP